jgi:adenosylmethionine---8-amino-7-oxononanoate aminotransferase
MTSWIDFDRNHVWHPYASMTNPLPVYPVASAEGVRLRLEDGRELVDGMASWWAVIHGYNHPVLNETLKRQVDKMAHVMFGGLTHRPAVALAERLIDITPHPLDKIFFADSGSVSVEVAIKMAIQYFRGLGQPKKQRLLTVKRGYHGDTFGAMSVTDPENGMHHLFSDVLPKHLFAEAPCCQRDEEWNDSYILEFRALIEHHCKEIAAVILEPIVQGAGGMRFYCPEYLRQIRALCDANDVLLIFDEIATGFGRTGTLFACEQAGVSPDIMCLGKSLTGGYMTLAATLTTAQVAEGVCSGEAGVFMHGPTFMANPLATAVALSSVDLLLESAYLKRVAEIERLLRKELEGLRVLENVADVRVKGAIGVVELKTPVNMVWIEDQFVARGVWIRPFGKLIYLMPPLIIEDSDIRRLTAAVTETVAEMARLS